MVDQFDISRRGFLGGAAVMGAGAMLAGLAACAPQSKAEKEARAEQELANTSDPNTVPEDGAGIYSATAMGMDNLTVTVDVAADGAINDLEVEHNETPTVGGAFISQLTKQGKERGDVDVISGATNTSRAFRDALRNCMAQFRGEEAPLQPDDNITPIEPVGVPESWTAEADVVIVGTSCGGLLCAAKLAEGGKSVIMLEKDSFAGGSGNTATMFHYFGGNEKLWPNNSGFFGTPYSDQQVIDYFMERFQWTVPREQIAHMTVCCREAVDFYLDHGYDIRSTADQMAGLENGTFADSDIRDIWWFQAPEPAEGDDFAGANGNLIKYLQGTAEDAGARIEFLTPATALVVEDGRVTGAQAQGPDGEVLYFRGNEAVVLAADGAQANREMMTKYGILGKNIKAAITMGTGKVMRMGIGVGADMAGIGSMAGTDSLMAPANWNQTGMLPRIKYLDAMNWYTHMPWLQIDGHGNRVAWETNGELHSQLVRVGDYLECYHRNMSQEMIYDDCYVFFDKNFKEVAASWGATDTGGHALLQQHLPNAHWVQTDEEASLQEHLNDGSLVMADTWEEVAEGLGIDAAMLAEAIEKWNAQCETGADDPMIGYDPAWMVKITEPPFYGARVTASPYATNFGLRVNARNEVLAEGGAVIPGLYAASHVAGGDAGVGSPVCGMGDQIGAMYQSGMNIAKAILGEEWVLI